MLGVILSTMVQDTTGCDRQGRTGNVRQCVGWPVLPGPGQPHLATGPWSLLGYLGTSVVLGVVPVLGTQLPVGTSQLSSTLVIVLLPMLIPHDFILPTTN